MSGQGQQIFIDVLARFAAQTADSRLLGLVQAIDRPLRVAVRGRPGVGASAVAAALAAAGYRVEQTSGAQPDVGVYVLAEVCKPEDRQALRGADGPVDLVLLNKADLTGWGPGGPLPRAQRQAARLTESTGITARAFVAPLACAALDPSVLDDRLVQTLRALVNDPADLRSPDAFVTAPHQVPASQRRLLVQTLDLFGIAHAVVTLRKAPAAGVDELRAALGAVSGIDEVRRDIDLAGVQARYRRITAACEALELRAITDAEVAEFLSCDDTVLARMAAAVDVVQAAGLTVDRRDDPAAHLQRALNWQRYAGGPVSAVHRSCGADIVRGSLRLLHEKTPA